MRAVIYRSLGGPDALEYVEDWEPTPRQSGEVKVKLVSTSFNPIDLKMLQPNPIVNKDNANLPTCPGCDIAGTVLEADEGSKFKVGQAVIAMTMGWNGTFRDGTWTEAATAKEDWIAKAPSNLSLEKEVGAIPAVALTAWQALKATEIKPGDRVLIHSGTGGIGHVAIQLAKQVYKAGFIATTSRNVAVCKDLGADDVIDYTKEDFAEKYKDNKFNGIVESLGGDTELKSYEVLADGGHYTQIYNPEGTVMSRKEEADKTWKGGKKYSMIFAQPSGKDLQSITDLIEQGRLKLLIDQVISLKEAKNIANVSKGRSAGKIVITI